MTRFKRRLLLGAVLVILSPHSRLRYPIEMADGRVYWILTRGR